MGKDPMPSKGSSGTLNLATSAPHAAISSSSSSHSSTSTTTTTTTNKGMTSAASVSSVLTMNSTLDDVLNNPLSKFKFGLFVNARHGSESLAFYTAICSFEKIEDELVRNKAGESLIARFVQPTAKHQVNLPSDLAESLMQIRNFERDSFQGAKQQMHDLMKFNFLTPFLLANLPKGSNNTTTTTTTTTTTGGSNRHSSRGPLSSTGGGSFHTTSSVRLPKISNSSISSDDMGEEIPSKAAPSSISTMRSPTNTSSTSGVLKTFSFAGLGSGGRNRSNSKNSSDDLLHHQSVSTASPIISPVIGSRGSRKMFSSSTGDRAVSPPGGNGSPLPDATKKDSVSTFSPLSPHRQYSSSVATEEEVPSPLQSGATAAAVPSPLQSGATAAAAPPVLPTTTRVRSASSIFASGGGTDGSTSPPVTSTPVNGSPSGGAQPKSLVARLREGVGAIRKSSSFSASSTSSSGTQPSASPQKKPGRAGSREIIRSSSRGEEEVETEEEAQARKDALAERIEKSQQEAGRGEEGQEDDDDVGEEEAVEEFKLDSAE